jgi:hypothetical protein
MARLWGRTCDPDWVDGMVRLQETFRTADLAGNPIQQASSRVAIWLNLPYPFED